MSVVALWICAALLFTGFAVVVSTKTLTEIAQTVPDFSSPPRSPETTATVVGTFPTTVPTSLCSSASDAIGTRSTFVSDRDVIRIAKDYYFNRARRMPRFEYLGQQLLEHAMTQNQFLLTLQIGGMDGKSSSDPMYLMTVKEYNKSLHHWLPIVVEPVAANFEKLKDLYQHEYSDQHGLVCYGLQQWAISYTSNETEAEDCTFCQFDVSDDAPEVCREYPDWLRYQVGTLDCKYSKEMFAENFEACIKRDRVPCGTVAQLLRLYQLQLKTTPIAILQIDVEGYESVMIPGLLEELAVLPPVIHFENKVMKERDAENNTTKHADVLASLKDHGYRVVEDQGTGDTLALRFDPNQEPRLVVGTRLSN